MKIQKTQVAIIGAGPSGLLLSLLLDKQGIDSVILERVTGEYVLGRIRAGVLEQGFAKLVREAGAAHNMDTKGEVHDGVEISFNDLRVPIELEELTGEDVIVYGQVDITRDMMEEREKRGLKSVYEAKDVKLHDVKSDNPYVTYTKDGEEYRLDCDYIAGCDGFHGVSRQTIPDDVKTEYEKVYPFGWLGIMAETKPVNNHLIYAKSDHGFALASIRNQNLTRLYIQVPVTDRVEDWSDERFYDEFERRMPKSVRQNIIRKPSIEKSLVPTRSFICEPLQYGNLFLVGDAGHIVPPTGAKGLNLAASDVATLYKIMTRVYKKGDKKCIEQYSPIALRRVWNGVRFSWWMTDMLHDFGGNKEVFDKKMEISELNYFIKSEAGRKIIAEQYVGLPYEELK